MSKDSGVKTKSTMVKDALVLFFITLIAALALGFVYEITKGPIAEAKAEAKTKAYKKVFSLLSDTREDEILNEEMKQYNANLAVRPEYAGSRINEILYALDSEGKEIGYVLSVSNSKGYGGEMSFAMGVDFEGNMTGLEFLSIKETAGLGMKAKEEKFTGQFFSVRVGQFSLKKAKIEGDTEVDAISSATVTTKAVTRGVNAGLDFVGSIAGKEGMQ